MVVAMAMMIAIEVPLDDCDDSHGGDNDYGDAHYFTYHRRI